MRDVPVVILAGGRGARFDHESQVLPKPMIEVAGRPILQHIIDGFVSQGFREFIVPTGYLGERIREHFERTGSRFSWNHPEGKCHYRLQHQGDPYFVKCWDTGEDSHTGERLVRIAPVIANRRFVLTYGDGLSDVRMSDVLALHEERAVWDEGDDHPAHTPPIVTLTAVNPPGRFGTLDFNGSYWKHVRRFSEKGSDEWISGGFMVCEPELLSVIQDPELTKLGDGSNLQLEAEALPELARRWLLRAHRHRGYWRCMDTRRDLEQIEQDVDLANGLLPWRRDMMMVS